MSDPNAVAEKPQPAKYTHTFQDLGGNEEPADMEVALPGWTPPPEESKADDPPEAEAPIIEVVDEEPPKKKDDEPDPRDVQLRQLQHELAEQRRIMQEDMQRRAHADVEAEKIRDEQSAAADTDRLTKLKTQMKAAYEAGASDDIVSLTDQMAELRANMLQRANKPKPEPRMRPSVPSPPAEAINWTQRNKWFNDQRYYAERAYAMAVDTMLTNDGMNPNDLAYYTELDKRMSKAFPKLMPGNSKPPPVAPVKPGAGPAAPRPGRVIITKADQAGMRRFGLDPDNKKHVVAWAQNKAADTKK